MRKKRQSRIRFPADEEEDKKQAAEEKRLAKEKLEKDKKYQAFLAQHGWTKEKEAEFFIDFDGITHTLYKKIGEIAL